MNAAIPIALSLWMILFIQAKAQINPDAVLQKEGGIKTFFDLGQECDGGGTACFSEPCYYAYTERGYSCVSPTYNYVSQLNSCSLTQSTAGSITFNPSVVGTYTIKEVSRHVVKTFIGPECQTSYSFWSQDATFTVTVEDMSWTVATLVRCEGDPNIDLSSLMSVGGVSFSATCGTCVSGTVFQTTVAGPGAHQVTATKAYGNGTKTQTITIQVNPKTSLTFGPLPDVCVNAPNLDLSGHITPSSGGSFSFSGPGVVAGTQFDPSNAGVGVHDLTFTFTNEDGCISSVTSPVKVANTFAIDAGPNLSRCANDASIDLASLGGFTPAGGSFSGPYVTSNVFDLAAAGVGSHTVVYTSNQEGCELSDSKTITVSALPTVEAGADLAACADAGWVLLGTADVTPGGGIWSGESALVTSAINNSSGQVNVGAIPPGQYVLTYTFTNAPGCIQSDTRNLWIKALPGTAQLTVVGASRCGPGEVTLHASHTVATHSFEWYDAPSGGAALSSGPGYSPSLGASSDFWVEVLSDQGCRSASRATVSATIHPVPASPAVTSAQRCGPGEVSLMASVGSASYRWYAGAAGGSPVATGSVYAPTVTTSQSFFADAVSVEGCVSATRAEGVVTIDLIPGPPTVFDGAHCGPGTVTLSAGGAPPGASFRWYPVPAGGSSFHGGSSYQSNFIQTTSFWVSSLSAQGCEGPRAEVTAVIHPKPPPPSGSGAERCGSGQLTLQGSSESGTIFDWYDTEFSAVSLFRGSNFVVSANLSTSFWLEVTDPMGCISNRSEVVATVLPDPDNPLAAPSGRCGPGPVVLSASGGPPGALYQWYETGQGGSPLLVGESFQPTLNLSRTFFVAVTSMAGCTSEGRTEVAATIHPVPSVATVTGGDLCGEGTVTLSAGGAGQGAGYQWYETGSSDEVIGTGEVFTTPQLINTRSYYASIVNSQGCEGQRAEAVATVNVFPERPVGQGATRCGGGEVTLSVETEVPTPTVNWYFAQQGGQPFANGKTLAIELDETSTFFATVQTEAGCESSREAVMAEVVEITPADIGGDLSLCLNGGAYDLAPDLGSGLDLDQGVFSGPGILDATFFPDIAGTGVHTISFDLTTEAGCLSIGSRSIRVEDVQLDGEALMLSASELNVCYNQGTVDLSFLPNIAGGQWEGSGIILDIFDPVIAGEGQVSAAYSVDLNGCLVQAPLTLHVLVVPETPWIAANHSSTCSGKAITLEAGGATSGTMYRWYSNQEVASFAQGERVTVSPEETTVFRVRAENVFGCLSDPAGLSIEVSSLEADFTVSARKIPFGGLVSFATDFSGAQSYQWDFGDGVTTPGQNPSHYYYEEGAFTVTLIITDREGCKKTITKPDLIQVEENSLVVVVGTEEVHQGQLAVYPNPVQDRFTLHYFSEQAGEADILVYSMLGQRVGRRTVLLAAGENQFLLDGRELGISQGVYYLRIRSRGTVHILRILKR